MPSSTPSVSISSGLISHHDPAHLVKQHAGYTAFPPWLDSVSIQDRIVAGQDRGGRDGVQTNTLIENEIHNPTEVEINDFFDKKWPEGFIIPYHNAIGSKIFDNGKPYARIRVRVPGDGPKYLQSKNTKPHIYIPKGLSHLVSDELVVVEGEIKALSLVEEGIPAVGIGGFYGLASKNVLIPEIVDLLTSLSIKKVYFLGDNDTSVNPCFSDAALKYSNLLDSVNPAFPISLYLPRIPLSQPKGIDDVKGALGAAFGAFWDAITTTAIHVPPFTGKLPTKSSPNLAFKDKRAELIFVLLAPELPFIASSSGHSDAEFFYRFANLSTYIPSKYLPNFEAMCQKVMYTIPAIQSAANDLRDLPYDASNKLRHGTKTMIMSMYGGKTTHATSTFTGSPSSPSLASSESPKVKVNLPSAPYTTPAESARQIFECLAKAKRFFFYNSAPAYLKNKEKLEFLGPDSLKYELPNYAICVRQVPSKLGYPKEIQEKYPSTEECKVVFQADIEALLPPLYCIHKAPILVRDGCSVKTLTQGYHSEAGGRHIVNGQVEEPDNFNEAVNTLKEIIADSPFNSESDRVRTLCALITPALVFGELLPSHSPLFFFEADFSQIGKGFLAELIQKVYGEAASLIGQQEGGVGSVDETLATALVKGTPFIQLDNFRGSFSAPYFEAVLTTGNNQKVSCRTPYAKVIDVDPKNRVFHFTSNGITTTNDLINRMCIIRLRQANLPTKFRTFPGNLSVLDYIEANQAKCLGSVLRIVKEWVLRGMPRRSLPGCSRFQLWWEVMEWFTAEIFGTISPRTDHEEVRQRIKIPDLGWLRSVSILACEKGPAKDLTAQKISDICLRNAIYAPTALGRSPVDRMLAGKTLNRIFSDSEDEDQESKVKIDEIQTVEIDGYSVSRVKRLVDRPQKGDKRRVVFYSFENRSPSAGSPPQDPTDPTVPPVPPVIPPSYVSVGRFERITEDIKLLVTQLAENGPAFDTLIAELSNHGISGDLAERAILSLIDTGRLLHLEGRFFPKDPEGYPALSPEDMHLAPEIQKANPVHMACLAHWKAFQLWTEGRLPGGHRQSLVRLIPEIVDDPDEWRIDESEEEGSKAGMELHMQEEK